jgi:hexokinase
MGDVGGPSLERDLNAILGALDLLPWDLNKLQAAHLRLIQEMAQGEKRCGEYTVYDSGLLAIDTGEPPVTTEDLKKIKDGTRCLACAYAGTHWITQVARFNASSTHVRFEEEVKTQDFVTDTEKKFDNLDTFIRTMCDQIIARLGTPDDARDITTVAISLGFPHQVIKTNYGVDAYLLDDCPSKGWSIPGAAHTLLGIRILEDLQKRGYAHISNIYIGNDTFGVAQDITAASGRDGQPCQGGIVAGSGDNVCSLGRLGSGTLINWEAGRSRAIERDAIIERMFVRDQQIAGDEAPLLSLVENQQVVIFEHYSGGNYLYKRLAIALELLHEQGVLNHNPCDEILNNLEGSRLLSTLAAPNGMTLDDFNQNIAASFLLNQGEFAHVQQVARNLLEQAGQAIGIMIASVADHAGWGIQGMTLIPIEGSVYWDGFGIAEIIQQTLQILLPDRQLQLIQGSGLRGIATWAMVRSAERAQQEDR